MVTVFLCRDCGSRQQIEHFGFADASPPICHGLAMQSVSGFTNDDTAFRQPGTGISFAGSADNRQGTTELDKEVEKALANADWELLEQE